MGIKKPKLQHKNPESPIKLTTKGLEKHEKIETFRGETEKEESKLTIRCICVSKDETWLQPYNAEYEQSQTHMVILTHLLLHPLPLPPLSLENPDETEENPNGKIPKKRKKT